MREREDPPQARGPLRLDAVPDDRQPRHTPEQDSDDEHAEQGRQSNRGHEKAPELGRHHEDEKGEQVPPGQRFLVGDVDQGTPKQQEKEEICQDPPHLKNT